MILEPNNGLEINGLEIQKGFTHKKNAREEYVTDKEICSSNNKTHPKKLTPSE